MKKIFYAAWYLMVIVFTAMIMGLALFGWMMLH